MDNKQEKTYAGMTRRTLCLGAGGAAVMLGLGGLKYAGSQPLVRPPGGQDEERLISACIRCEKCYEICPRDVIAPAHLEDGVLNMRTPTFDFSANWCDWCAEEHDGTPLCVSACPTEALKLPDDATAENTIIGKAVINTDWCLAYKLIGCRFCYDAGPYEAMELDEAEAVLDAIGLRLLAEDWLLEEDDPQTGEASWTRVRIREIHRDRVIVARAVEDLSATSVAKSVDLIGAIELPLPTTRLRSASARC